MVLKLIQRDGWWHIKGTDPAGRLVRKSCRTRDRAKAEQLKTAIEVKLWNNHVFGKEVVLTFEDAALAYIKDGGETRFILKVAEYFKGELLKDIFPANMRAGALKVYPDAQNSTRNRQFIVPASAVINFAHDQGWCNPIRVRRFKEEPVNQVYVDSNYIEKLIPHCNPYLGAIVIFINQTGRRIGEVLSVTPEQINFETMEIHIPKTKNSEPFSVPIPSAVFDFLSNYPPRHGRSFGYAGRSSLRKALIRACARAEVPYVPTHQLGRHSFATALEMEGWSNEKIAKAGGWKSTKMVRRYAHASPETRKAVEILSRK